MSRSRRSTLLRGCVGVEQEGVAAPHLFGQDRDEHVGDAGMLLSKPVGARPGRPARGSRLPPALRLSPPSAPETERRARRTPRQARRASTASSPAGSTRTAKRPFAIQMQRVGRVALVEHDLAAEENVRRRATASSRRTSGVGTPRSSTAEVSRI